MARGINKVILVGNLGADPELRYTANGIAVTTLSVATNESWVDKQTGQQQERTEWHRVVVFSKLAEIAGQYLHKGSKVYFEGKLQTRKWQDQTGIDRYTTEILVDGFGGQMLMLDSGVEQHPPPVGSSVPPKQNLKADSNYQELYTSPADINTQSNTSAVQNSSNIPNQTKSVLNKDTQPAQTASEFNDFDDDIPF